ncbi:MAG: diguanylate cyclase [Pseudomonadota bacterium]
MTDMKYKRHMLVAKQQLDKLSLFIINLSKFFEGTNPKIDAELLKIRKMLSSKPDYGKAAEASAEINALLASESKYLQQQQITTISEIENSLRRLNDVNAIDKTVRSEIKAFLTRLKDPEETNSPIDVLEKSLVLFRKALANNAVSQTAAQIKTQHQITLELNELLDPHLKKNPNDSVVTELKKKLSKGLSVNELLECCLGLIRFVMRDVVQEAGVANKLIQDIHHSLQNVNQGLKNTIEKSRSQIQQRSEQCANMQSQISAMETALLDAEKIEDVKAHAQTYLHNLQSSLSQSETRDRDEHEKMIVLLISMQKRIDELENKAQKYKDKLNVQRNDALTDSLTQLPNRLAYEEFANATVKQALLDKSAVCMAVADIDHFKSINDKYGHSVGDKTLQVIAGQFKKQLAKDDYTARWGGEEFIILFPKTGLSDALKRVEHLRESISQLPFMFKGNRVSVTISIGLVECDLKKPLEEAFEYADKLLYQAKDAGRNQTQTSFEERENA